ncbi:MAG: hydroxyacylglutathione hydrolase [Verrucomicrobiota bacterium]
MGKPGPCFETKIGDAVVLTLPILGDNYAYVLVSGHHAAAVDPADASRVSAVLAERKLRLSLILNTHHHGDHVAGNADLKAATGCGIGGPADGRIPGLDRPLGGGSIVDVGRVRLWVMATPGHTRSHVAYCDPVYGMVFTGDTLFAGGCGRLLEGTAADLWDSLCRLADLADETMVFCGHNYTVENLRFAAGLEPANNAVRQRLENAERQEAQGLPTVPSTMALEKATNPFLRAARPELAAALGMKGARPVDVFAELRRRKDVFG